VCVRGATPIFIGPSVDQLNQQQAIRPRPILVEELTAAVSRRFAVVSNDSNTSTSRYDANLQLNRFLYLLL